MAGKYPPLGSLKKLADENAASLKKAYELKEHHEPYVSGDFETFKVFPPGEVKMKVLHNKIEEYLKHKDSGLPPDVLIIDPISSPDPKLQESAGKLFEKLKAIAKDLSVPIFLKSQHKDPLKNSKLLIDTESKPDPEITKKLGIDFGANPCGEIPLTMAVELAPMPYVEMKIFTLGSNIPVPLAPKEKEAEVGLSKLSQKNGKKKTAKVKKADAIFQWTFKSNQEVQGTRAMYSTLLRSDQTLTCNCPGWIFKKKGETERFCKHTKQVEEEAKGIFKKWKSGGQLPTILQGDSAVSDIPTTKATAVPGIKYGRVIEID